MTGALDVVATGLRCTDQFAALDASPVGTTARCTAMLVVELALPWPPDIGVDQRLSTVAALCAARDHRLQAVVPRSDTPVGSVRLVRFTAAADTTGFHRSERIVDAEDLDDAAAELLAVSVPSAPVDGAVTDVFICTNGARDRCCGKLGTKLYQQVRDLLPDGVRVWRTSHLGGHRFAPTALTMPDGHAWSHLDAALLAGIVGRTAAQDSLVAHDRGAASLADRWQQAADAALLQRHGWHWLSRPRTLRTLPGSSEDHRLVRVETRDDDADAWVVEVRSVRSVPVPVCGQELEAARKSEPDLRVGSISSSR